MSRTRSLRGRRCRSRSVGGAADGIATRVRRTRAAPVGGDPPAESRAIPGRLAERSPGVGAWVWSTADGVQRRPPTRPCRSEARRWPQTQDAERAQIVERAAEAGERQGCRRADLREFLARYYRHVAMEDLRERDPVDLAGAALSHRQLAAARPQGTANVRVFTPTVDEHGWSCGHTVVEIVTDDMPFLVDSVNAELSRQDRGDPPRRAPAGRGPPRRHRRRCSRCSTLGLGRLGGRRAPARRRGRVVDPRRDRPGDRPRATSSATASGLRRVLEDVRVAVEDWPRMRERARDIADALDDDAAGRARPAPRSQEAPAAAALARRRALHLPRATASTGSSCATGRTSWSPRPAPGWASCATTSTQASPQLRPAHAAGPGEGPREAPARAHQGEHPRDRAPARPTWTTSASRPSTPTARSIGERRFLGLFASAAYTDSVRGIPVVRRKVAGVLEPVRLLAGQPLRQGPAADPRDLPARRAVRDRRRRPVRHRRSR